MANSTLKQMGQGPKDILHHLLTMNGYELAIICDPSKRTGRPSKRRAVRSLLGKNFEEVLMIETARRFAG
jgi:hypothetical protein